MRGVTGDKVGFRGVLFDSGDTLTRPVGGRWNPRFDFEEIVPGGDRRLPMSCGPARTSARATVGSDPVHSRTLPCSGPPPVTDRTGSVGRARQGRSSLATRSPAQQKSAAGRHPRSGSEGCRRFWLLEGSQSLTLSDEWDEEVCCVARWLPRVWPGQRPV